MKVLYIFREKEKKEHSIEAVFDTVAKSMEDLGHKVYKWYKPVSWKQTFCEIYKLRKEKFDVYHITGDVNYLWLFFPWNKTTMTCHDIGMYKNHPKTLIRILYVFISFILSSFFLKKITAVSLLTKNDLIHYLHINKNAVEVISNPLSLPLQKKTKKFNKECPTILQIGSGWHKNLEGLLESIKDIKCHVEIVGQPEKENMKRLKNYGINYTISHHISVQELIHKYEESDILYFVSRSEGFGMPIIEAQTVGRVVLTTDSEPTKSVSNGAALLFDPEDHQAIHDGLVKIINDDKLREQLIINGYINADRYKPEYIGKLYESFYQEIFNID